MSAYHLSYLSLFRGCALFWDISTFWFFLFIINREPHSVVFVSTNEKRLQNQVYRPIKSKLMDTFGSGIWFGSPFEKGLTSPYIVFYLHFLNLNNILTLSKLSLSLKLGLIWHDLCLPCFLPARFTRMRASLRNQNKCKPSIGIRFTQCVSHYINWFRGKNDAYLQH